MEKFKQFYKNPTIEELKELMGSTTLNNSNLYEFLTSYSAYLESQRRLDDY